MSNFNLNTRMMEDPSAVLREMMKDSPENLKTSASTNPKGDPLDVTLFDMSNILQGRNAIKSTTDVLAGIESKVQGSIGLILDEIGSLPGISNLLPDSIIERFAGSSAAGPEVTASNFSGTYSDTEERDNIRRVISLASAEVGTRESPKGSNQTPYASMAGVANGQYWCATFLMAMFNNAGLSQGGLLTPATQGSYENYEKAGRTGKQPLIGSLFLWRYSSGAGHTGLVIGVEGDKIITIEGNTSIGETGDQRNGEYVAQKTRLANYSKLRGYIYPVYSVGGN